MTTFKDFAKDILKNAEINKLVKKYNLSRNKFEKWTRLENYSAYLISSAGRVFSLHSKKILKVTPHPYTKYLKIKLRKDDGTVPTWYLHRLVATAFLPRFANQVEVNHIDGNKRNNSVYNLEWMTKEENIRHAQLNGLGNVKLKPQEVRSVFYLAYASDLTQEEIGEMYGVGRNVVSAIKNRRAWEHVTEEMHERILTGRNL